MNQFAALGPFNVEDRLSRNLFFFLDRPSPLSAGEDGAPIQGFAAGPFRLAVQKMGAYAV